MHSQLKSHTARPDGAKSRGAAETRDKISLNSLHHGFNSNPTMLIECGNADEFKEIEDELAVICQPATPAEQGLVGIHLTPTYHKMVEQLRPQYPGWNFPVRTQGEAPTPLDSTKDTPKFSTEPTEPSAEQAVASKQYNKRYEQPALQRPTQPVWLRLGSVPIPFFRTNKSILRRDYGDAANLRPAAGT